MFDKLAHHIPQGYASLPVEGATMWVGTADTDCTATKALQRLAGVALREVIRLLRFEPRRQIHVVMYSSLADSELALSRKVSPTFLMAPLHTPESAVIVIHSPRLDPRNGDPSRMLRHLCHEVSHVCAAERTGSTKRLGDGNAGMRLRPWVDEGLAVCVAAEAAGQHDVIERALAAGFETPSSMDVVDSELCALDSERRSWAFGVATSLVWAAKQRHGFRTVFDHLDEPKRWS